MHGIDIKGWSLLIGFQLLDFEGNTKSCQMKSFSAANELNFSVDSISMENGRYRIICKGVEDTFIFKHSKFVCYSSFGK